MRIALAQIDTVVGDLDGNRERILRRLEEARGLGADLVCFPELAVTGYPPEDLLLRPAFIREARRSLERIASETTEIVALVGAPLLDRDLHNTCAVLAEGEIRTVYPKRFLPNYGVFDEDRYFAPGRRLFLLRQGDVLIGPTVCEDLWQPGPPMTELALAGAQLVTNLSASPFHVGKDREREEMLVVRARDNSCYVAFCNAVGAQDELVFDGHSVVIDDEGRVVARAPGFEEALLVVAVEALGPERVHCVSVPSRYSSEGTRGDARRLAESLGSDFLEVPIGAIVDAFAATLAGPFAGRAPDLTEENLQARIRGVLLMA